MVCVVASIWLWHGNSLGSILGHGKHGIFSVKTWLSTLVNQIIMLMSVPSQFGMKRTTDDNKYPGSDHPQCQHRKVGVNVLKKCSEKGWLVQ